MDGDAAAIQLTCTVCQEPFWHRDRLFFDGREVFQPTHCPDCLEGLSLTMENQRQRDARAASAARRLPWERLALGDEYFATDITHSGLDPDALQAALAWRPGPRGLGIIGEARRGKTRSLHLALRRAWEDGRSCLALSELTLSNLARDASTFGNGPKQRDARDMIERAHTVAVLLLDDVGKAGPSPAHSSALYGLLEARTSHRLPILWSSQASGQWIEEKYGPDHGPAITARLGLEFCQIVKLK